MQGQDGIAALYAPNAPHTWEAKTFLPSASPQTEAVQVPFSWPTLIVGMRPSLVVVPPSSPGVLIAPTLEDIEVQIDVNSQNFITNASGIGTLAGDRDGNFISLPSIGVQVPRLMSLLIDGDNPMIRFIFRWARGQNVYFDTKIRLAIFGRRAQSKPSSK